jgi:hypothetical protein
LILWLNINILKYEKKYTAPRIHYRQYILNIKYTLVITSFNLQKTGKIVQELKNKTEEKDKIITIYLTFKCDRTTKLLQMHKGENKTSLPLAKAKFLSHVVYRLHFRMPTLSHV